MKKEEETAGACNLETGICTPAEQEAQATPTELEGNSQPQLRLTYYFDALCGWCYGFSPVLAQIQADFGDCVAIEVVSGGLFLGSRVGKINQIAPYIKSGAYKSVEARTGVKFGQPFLDDVLGDGKMTLDSILPAVALCIVKEKAPEKAIEFAGILLAAFYAEGMDSIEKKTFVDCAGRIGLESKQFAAWMEDEKYLAAAQEDFESFQASGLRGMPALVVETEADRMLLANGYVHPEELMPRLERLLKEPIQ